MYGIRQNQFLSKAVIFNRLRTPLISSSNTRCLFSTDESGKLLCTKLESRAVIQLHGPDTGSFLQGLITNDIGCFTTHKCNSLYTVMLNVQGRILYDFILYKLNQGPEETDILLECDRNVTTDVIKTLKRYKIRKKVELVDVSDKFNVWALHPESLSDEQSLTDPQVKQQSDVISLCADPRLKSLGFRCILNTSTSISDVIENIKISESEDGYIVSRYKLGIAEGIKDLQPGKPLPLESNLVFLNGVNFNKGCYIGQELTARTHHTGVTRKRIMPLKFESATGSEGLQFDDSIKTDTGKGAGKYRGGLNQYGIGLVRLLETDKSLHVEKSDGSKVNITVSRPTWWPENVKLPTSKS